MAIRREQSGAGRAPRGHRGPTTLHRGTTHPLVQHEIGPENRWELVEGEEPVFFPNYHSNVDDYLKALELDGTKIVAVLDIPMKLKGELFEGALIVWAKKSGERI